MSEENNKVASEKPVKIWRAKNIHLVTKENDIKFRGPLSYRHLRIMGWIFVVIAQIGIILGLADKAKLIVMNPVLLTVIQSASILMTPLFLFAAFAQVLVAKDGYKRLLRTYILGAVAIYIVFVIAFLHFGVGLLYSMSHDWNKSYIAATQVANAMNYDSSVSINIFIDLVLCTLITFFINYRPTKHFQGKKIYLFRALVALPILYEISSCLVKIFCSEGYISVSPLFIPLMSTKSPVMIFVFIAMALFVKFREKYYIKRGRTHSDYKEFLSTNVNRLHFSLFLVAVIIVAVILDIALFVFVFALKAQDIPADSLIKEKLVLSALDGTSKLGFGKCVPMILLIPVVIFFDYTKTYKNKIVDLIIPAAGLALVALVYVEGLYDILRGYLFTRSNNLKVDPDANPAILLIKSIKDRFRK